MSDKRIGSGELFPTDTPVQYDKMIGRQNEVSAAVRALAGGTNLVVIGPRRIGKTSVCDAALEQLSAQGHYVASTDLFRVADAAELAEQLVLSVLANRKSLRRFVAKTRRAGKQLADAVALTTAVKASAELGEEVEIAFRPGFASRDPDRYLNYALELPQRIAEADGKRVILFLDEFQEIASPKQPFGDPDRLTKRMRAIFQRSANVSFLFAGSMEHLMRDLFIPSERALSQFGSFFSLPPIPPEVWEEGIISRLEEDDCKIDPFALQRLVKEGEGHPRVTMLIARWTHEASVIEGTKNITESHVSAGIRGAQLADLPKHDQTLERIRSLNRHAQKIITRIANNQQVYKGLSPKIVADATRALRDAGLITQDVPGEWRIVDPLLRNYLVAVHGELSN
jgi:hypothetical protein